MPMTEEEIVELVEGKTAKELTKILKLRGLTVKGNKKAKRAKVLEVLLKERAEMNIATEDNGEGKAVDNVLAPELVAKHESDTEAVDEETNEVDEKLNGMEQRLRYEMNMQFQNIQSMLSSLTISNGQTLSELNEIVNDELNMNDISDEDVELGRSASVSSLSGGSTTELKIKFDIIMKEMKGELKNLKEAVKAEKSVSAVKVGVDYLKSKEERCGRLIDKYAGLDSDEEELNNMIEQWLSIQNECREIRTEAEDYLYEKRKKEDEMRRVKQHVKLPELSVNKYSGDPLEWPNWIASFKRCVHDNKELSESAKHDYLMRSVIGKAEQAIKGYFDDPNKYEKALEVLQKRFGNNRLVSKTYLTHFLETREPEQNADAMRKHFDRQLNATGTLKMYKVDDDSLKLAICEKTLPPMVKREWEKKYEEIVKSKNVVKLEDYFEFYDNEITSWEATKNVHLDAVGHVKKRRDFKKFSESKRNVNNKKTVESFVSSTQSLLSRSGNSQSCLFCDSKSHASVNCKSALTKDVEERWKLVSAARCCFNCLQPMRIGHNSQSCSEVPCGVSGCQLKHSRLLHSSKGQEELKGGKNPDKEHATSSKIAATKKSTTDMQKLCPMAIGTLIYQQKEVPVRVFLDTGSCESYVTENIADSMNMEKIHSAKVLTTSGFGGQTTRMSTRRVKFSLSKRDRTDEDEAVEIEAWTTKKICDPVEPVEVDLSRYPQLKDIQLADEYPRGPSTVDVLVGVDYASLFEKNKKLKIDERLVASESIFGWIIQGVLTDRSPRMKGSQRTTTMLTGAAIHDQELREGLAVLWSLERTGTDENKVLTPEEASATRQFHEKLKFDEEDGRYEVNLPWKPEHPSLKDNYEEAFKRLRSVEQSLARNPERKQMYCEAMERYFIEGHARVVDDDESSDRVRYLPHHAVYRMDKKSTKCRIVFDGSAKTRDGVSLNDCLLEGPNILPELVHILIRFRCQRVALCGDIQSMFLQIKLSPEEQSCHRFLWRNMEIDKPPVKCCMTRVTFGVKSSPFVSESTIRTHVERHENQFPVAAAEVKDNMYVDDLATGADDVNSTISLRRDVTKMLQKGGFYIRKWASNSVEVMETIPEEDCSPEMITDSNEKQQGTLRTLGVAWDTHTDCLFYNATTKAKPAVETKKTMLSRLASTFDPVGNYSPVMIRGKCMIKEAWIRGLEWDEPLPNSLAEEFTQWRLDLENLHSIRIQRCFMKGLGKIANAQLHGFSDSSEKAYGGAVYLRLEDELGNIESHLVMSKTRLAPIKRKTLPRLELCGAVVLAHLISYVMKAMRIEVSKITCWTDSMIVLNWLRRPAGTWRTFVANRVQEIQDRTEPNQWNHVEGKENPADLLTRGLTVDELRESKLWWNGPPWLRLPEQSWPLSEIIEHESQYEEMRKNVLVTQQPRDSEPAESSIPSWTCRFEKWLKLLRVTARVLSWKRLSADRQQPELSCEDLKRAEVALIRCVQRKYYDEELRLLREGKTVGSQSKILKLDPQLDKDGIMRVGGRLQQAQISEDSKHQIILPHGEQLVAKIILNTHTENAHAGPETTLAILRERYWVTQGRRETKRVLLKCLICKHQKTVRCTQKMGDLPPERVKTWVHAGFVDVGLDFLGPIIIKEGKATRKVWICLFVDANSRAVHLEVCPDMTTEEFLDAYRRMSNRRGISETITSDNQSSFHKADKVLSAAYRNAQAVWKRLDKKEIERRFVSMGIKWKFNTERASHQGGQWEKFCDKVKRPLKLVVGKALLTYQELQTVLTDIEAQINSRPITYIGDDISDGMVITPAHLVLGRPLGRLPDFPNRFEKEIKLKKRFLYRQRIADHFWKRFQKEYLPTLNVRSKWHTEQPPLNLGDVVLVAEDNAPRCKWIIAKVVELFVGRGGLVRNVKVKTPRGYLNRPVQKLHLLEESSKNDLVKEKQEREKREDEDYLQTAKEKAETSSPLPREDVQDENEVKTRSGRVIKKPVRYRNER